MKKILFLAFFSLTLLAPTLSVTALDLGSGLAKDTAVQAGYSKNTSATSLAELVGSIIKVGLSVSGVILFALFFYAGFLWMTARGDESAIEKAKGIIQSAVIGLIIAVSAYSITNFIVPRIVEKTTGEAGVGGGGGPNPNDAQLVGCCEICEVGGVLAGSCSKSQVANREACAQSCRDAGGRCQESSFELVPAGSCR